MMMFGPGEALLSGLLLAGLLLAGLGVLVVVALRLGGRGRRSAARQILDERFARGELTTEEYAERLRALGDGS
jgi:putative membrane protein